MKVKLSKKYSLNLTTFMDNIGGPVLIMGILTAVVFVWALCPELR